MGVAGRVLRRVVGLDTVAARRMLAAELGAVAASIRGRRWPPQPILDRHGCRAPPAGVGVVESVRAIALIGEVVLEVSGTQPGLETALAIVRPKGRVALVGSQQRLDRFDLFWPLQTSGARIVPLYREGSVSVQSPAGNPAQRWLPLVHEMLGRGWLRIDPLVTWVVSPEVAPLAMDLLHRRPDLAVGMAIAWDPSLARDDPAVVSAAAGVTLRARGRARRSSRHRRSSWPRR
jgi:threonine dehydrogenase-like Zn-dependent dehydrogenase